MYQPQTHQARIESAQNNPNTRRKRRLLEQPKAPATPRGAKPDSSRTLRKILARTKASTAAMEVDNAMEAAEKRGEVWEPNPKLRKPNKVQ